jgi:hypothetical protein
MITAHGESFQAFGEVGRANVDDEEVDLAMTSHDDDGEGFIDTEDGRAVPDEGF